MKVDLGLDWDIISVQVPKHHAADMVFPGYGEENQVRVCFGCVTHDRCECCSIVDAGYAGVIPPDGLSRGADDSAFPFVDVSN